MHETVLPSKCVFRDDVEEPTLLIIGAVMIVCGFLGGFFGARYARIHCDQEHGCNSFNTS